MISVATIAFTIGWFGGVLSAMAIYTGRIKTAIVLFIVIPPLSVLLESFGS